MPPRGRRVAGSGLAVAIALGACSAPATPSPTEVAEVPRITEPPIVRVPEVEARCSSSLKGTVVPAAVASPSLVALRVAYAGDDWGPPADQGGWQAPPNLLPSLATTMSLADARSVLCIEQSRAFVGYYGTTIVPAYTIQWEVRLLRWPDGALVAATTLNGGEPPATQSAGHAGYGAKPLAPLEAWLDDLITP